MNGKRGLVGMIFLILGIIILIVGVIVGFTAFQAYSLFKTVQTEAVTKEAGLKAIQAGDCSKIPETEASINKILTESTSACKNPLLRYISDKIEQLPVKCQDIPTLEQQIAPNLSQLKAGCLNQSKTA